MMQRWSPEEISAREQIRDVVARYNTYCDSGRFEEMAECFTPNAYFEEVLLDRPKVECHGRHEIRAAIDMVSNDWLEEAGATSGGLYIRHCVSTHVITMVDESAATGTAYVLAVFDYGLDHWGRYRDEYRLHEGSWLISRRTARMDRRIPRDHG